MALQPLPGPGLPHKTSPFISICSSSPPSSCPQQFSSISSLTSSNIPCTENQFLFLATRSSSIYWFHPRHLWGFLNTGFFPGWGRYPHTHPPTWRTRVSLSVWVITFDLSGLGDPASSYVTTGLALRIICPHKPHPYVKVETPSGGILYFASNNSLDKSILLFFRPTVLSKEYWLTVCLSTYEIMQQPAYLSALYPTRYCST